MSDQISRLATFLPYRISITSNAISELIAGEYQAQFGLKIPEWRIMAVLGEVASSTQRELAHTTRMDKVAVNRACKSLGDRGLVDRSPNTRDGRSHMLRLTGAGQALYAEIMPLALDMERQLLEGLTAKDRERLDAILARLLEVADGLAASQDNRTGQGAGA